MRLRGLCLCVVLLPLLEAHGPCRGVARYQLTLVTSWTAKRFPKQYPRWRPPAQWSRLIGMSHGDGTRLWQLDAPASEGVARFAADGEQGASSLIASLVQGRHGVLDVFHGPAIPKGSGSSSVTFFVDGRHHKVSALVRLVPSPDWLAGLDSADLCPGGVWRDAALLDAQLVDGGTDLGFTFTAPRWEADPRENVSRITSKQPSHPAGSFYYPHLDSLPQIAFFRFRKLRTFYAHHHGRHQDGGGMRRRLTSPRPTAPDAELSDNELESSGALVSRPTLPTQLAYGDASHSNEEPTSPPLSVNRPKRRCVVSPWSSWEPCSRTCGTGKTRRQRVLLLPGDFCPHLSEVRPCGFTRGCGSQIYFRW